jgi:hypothetical protein
MELCEAFNRLNKGGAKFFKRHDNFKRPNNDRNPAAEAELKNEILDFLSDRQVNIGKIRVFGKGYSYHLKKGAADIDIFWNSKSGAFQVFVNGTVYKFGKASSLSDFAEETTDYLKDENLV